MLRALCAALALAASASAADASSTLAAPAPPAADPIAAVSGLVTRLLGPAALPRFRFEVIPADPATARDAYEMDAAGELVVLRGNTGVALSTALNNYLKYSCNISISWGRNMSGVLANLPPSLPLPAPSRTVFPMKWREWLPPCLAYIFSLVPPALLIPHTRSPPFLQAMHGTCALRDTRLCGTLWSSGCS
jgi:hypothetical protein